MNCLRNKIFMIIGLLLLLAPSVFSQIEGADGFYDKRQIKGFFSIKGDYRRMSDESVDKLNNNLLGNTIMFRNYWYDLDSNLVSLADNAPSEYDKFDEHNFGGAFEAGAQYKQMITWINFQFVLPYTSPKKRETNDYGVQMYDVRYSSYGADWMFGWMLLNEDARINFIPSVGFGVSLVNLQFPGAYIYFYDAEDEDADYMLEEKYYSALGYTVTGEMEVRLNLAGGLSVGGYGGYRFSRYDAIEIEYSTDDEVSYISTNDQYLDHWYAGVKLTFTMKSALEKIAAERSSED